MPGTSIEGWTQTFITKDCKDPQKAMELLTYMVSEYGNTVMNYGREGETYTMVDGNPVLNADLLEFKQTDPAGFEKEIGLTTHLWVQDTLCSLVKWVLINSRRHCNKRSSGHRIT